RQIRDGVLGEIPVQPLFLVGLDEQQRQCGDHRREPEQEQFGVAPVGERGSDGHRGLRLGGHEISRQFVPGSGGGGGGAVGDGDGDGGGGEGGPGGAGDAGDCGSDGGVAPCVTVRGISGAGV